MVRLLKVFLHVPTFSISVFGKVLHQAGSDTAGIWEYGNMGIQEYGNILQHGGCSSCSQSQHRTRSVSRWSLHKDSPEDLEEYQTEMEFCWCDHLLNACMKNIFKIFIPIQFPVSDSFECLFDVCFSVYEFILLEINIIHYRIPYFIYDKTKSKCLMGTGTWHVNSSNQKSYLMKIC